MHFRKTSIQTKHDHKLMIKREGASYRPRHHNWVYDKGDVYGTNLRRLPHTSCATRFHQSLPWVVALSLLGPNVDTKSVPCLGIAVVECLYDPQFLEAVQGQPKPPSACSPAVEPLKKQHILHVLP